MRLGPRIALASMSVLGAGPPVGTAAAASTMNPFTASASGNLVFKGTGAAVFRSFAVSATGDLWVPTYATSATCVLYWDAGGLVASSTTADGTVDGSNNVTSFGRVNAMAEATNPPLYEATGLNGGPSVKFDGSNDKLVAGAGASAANGNDVAFSIGLRFQSIGTFAATHCMWDIGASGSNTQRVDFINNTTPLWRFEKVDDVSGSATQGGKTPDTSVHTFTMVCPGTTVTTRFDGVVDANGAAFNVGQQTLNQFTLGGRNGSSFTVPHNFRTSRGAIFTGALGATDLAYFETWLALLG